MIRFSLLILSLFSLIYGVYFLFFPFNFVDLTEAKYTNIAWLRNIGAAITGLLFIGLFSIYLNPKGSLKLLNVIIITSLMQTSALIYSRLFDEFSAKNIMVIDLTIVVALLVTIYLILLNIYKKNFFI